MSKLAKIVETAKDEMQAGLDAQMETARLTRQQQTASELFGGIVTLNATAKNLTAQIIRGLELFKEQRGYEEYGYTRFDDFLDKHQKSPMTYRQFDERRKLLAAEGEEIFDALNSLNIPAAARKLLSAGQIEIAGDEIIVGEQRANLSETRTVKELIKTLAAEAAHHTATIETGKAQVEKYKAEIKELRANGGAGETAAAKQSPLERAYVHALGGLSELAAQLRKATPEARAAWQEQGLEFLATQYTAVQDALIADDDDNNARFGGLLDD